MKFAQFPLNVRSCNVSTTTEVSYKSRYNRGLVCQVRIYLLLWILLMGGLIHGFYDFKISGITFQTISNISIFLGAVSILLLRAYTNCTDFKKRTALHSCSQCGRRVMKNRLKDSAHAQCEQEHEDNEV